MFITFKVNFLCRVSWLGGQLSGGEGEFPKPREMHGEVIRSFLPSSVTPLSWTVKILRAGLVEWMLAQVQG